MSGLPGDHFVRRRAVSRLKAECFYYRSGQSTVIFLYGELLMSVNVRVFIG